VARNQAERRLWRWAGAVLVAILVSVYPAQFLLDALRQRGWLTRSVWALFFFAAVVLLVVLWRQRPSLGEWILFAIVGATYLVLLRRMTVIQERVHFLEYGLLGGLVFGALGARAPEAPPWRQAGLAILLTGLAGWADELLQAVLPNRVYDLRDVGFNTLAGAMVVGTLLVRQWIRPGARTLR
jgi:VanZ family protein